MAKTFEFDAYLIMLADPERGDYKASDYAKELDVNVMQIYKWNSQIDWEEVKAARRKAFSRRTTEVDDSLFKATKKGDVAAIRTWYERFDSWMPASKVVNEEAIPDAELDEAIDGFVKLIGKDEAEKACLREVEAATGRADAILPPEPGPEEVP
mgnify:CR=1 FL=1